MVDPFFLWRNGTAGPIGRTAARGSYSAWEEKTRRAARVGRRRRHVNRAAIQATRHPAGCAQKRMRTLQYVEELAVSKKRRARDAALAKGAVPMPIPSWANMPTVLHTKPGKPAEKEERAKRFRSPIDPPTIPVRQTRASRKLRDMHSRPESSCGLTSLGYETSLPQSELWRTSDGPLGGSLLVTNSMRPGRLWRPPTPRLAVRPTTASSLRQRKIKRKQKSTLFTHGAREERAFSARRPPSAPPSSLFDRSASFAPWIRPTRPSASAKPSGHLARARKEDRVEEEEQGWVIGHAERLSTW